MAWQKNRVDIVGNLGATPELRQTTSGRSVTNLSVATSRKYKTQDGDLKSETTWVKVAVFGKAAENCCKYLKIGNSVMIEGRLTNRKWKDKEGNDRSNLEITATQVDFPPKPKTAPAEDSAPAESASPASDGPSYSEE